MQIVTNAARSLRTHLRTLVVAGSKPLILVGPKHLPQGYAGRTGYFYATEYNGALVTVSKNPASTRDAGRGDEAVRRFGRKASEYRPVARKSRLADAA